MRTLRADHALARHRDTLSIATFFYVDPRRRSLCRLATACVVDLASHRAKTGTRSAPHCRSIVTNTAALANRGTATPELTRFNKVL